MSMRSISTVSSEEGEASEYPSSQRSTLESNPDIQNHMASMVTAKEKDHPENLLEEFSDGSIEEDDDLSVVTVTTARESSAQVP